MKRNWYEKSRRLAAPLFFFLIFSVAARQSGRGAQQAPSGANGGLKFTSASSKTFTQGTGGSFTVTTNGNPAPLITVTGNVPSSVTFKNPKLTVAKTAPAGTYTLKFAAGAVSQNFVLTIKPKSVSTVNQSGQSCSKAFSVQLNVLSAVDASALAATLNGNFNNIAASSVPPPAATPKSGQAAQNSDSTTSASTSEPPQTQFLCLASRDSKGLLTPFDATTSQEATEILAIVSLLDRPAFVNIGLDSDFLVHLSHLNPTQLARLLPAPGNGISLVEARVDSDFVVLYPANTDVALAAKSDGDLALQAAKVKHDLLALDAESLLNETNANAPKECPMPQETSETWELHHTARLLALDPLQVARNLRGIFPCRAIKVLMTQSAVTFLPSDPPTSWSFPASEAIERGELTREATAQLAWQQQLAADAASNAKQGSSNPQPATTQTTSNTTVSTSTPVSPAGKNSSSPNSGSSTKAPPIQIQTSTSTQTSFAGGQQAAASNASQSNGGSAQPGGNTGAAATSGQGSGNANSSQAGGQTTAQSGSGAKSQAGSTLPQNQPLSTGKIVRLFHLRQATNIATVLNALAPAGTSSPLVAPLSDNNNDDLLLILPPQPGQPNNTASISRIIALLDEPRPTISLQVWSYLISSDTKAKPDDTRALRDAANDVSDAYEEFWRAVQDADGHIQKQLAAGVAAAMNVWGAERPSKAAQASNDKAFFDRTFAEYLTGRFSACIQRDNYCLGFADALNFGSSADTHTVATLERFVVLMAAVSDANAKGMIDTAVGQMNDSNACDSRVDRTHLCFKYLKPALEALAEPRNLRRFRVALLDFLFWYKFANEYPNDFDPYHLQRSAQTLDGFLNDLMTALNRDLDSYIHESLRQKALEIASSNRFGPVGLANYGEVQVGAISGDAAAVSGSVQNYFDITQPALLKDLVSSLLGGAGGGNGGNSAGNNGGSGSSGSGSSPTGSTTASSNGAGTSGGANAGKALASAASLLTPWQTLALNALVAASSPAQLVAQVNSQTTLTVTPISLDTASAAELNIALQISNPTTTIDASKGSPSPFVRQDLADSVSNYTVNTKVRVDSLKLFQVSSLSMDLTHPQSSVPIPVVGWIYEAIFGTVPWMKDHILAIPREPKTVENRSVAVVRAVVVPTAMDLGLGMPFNNDHIDDPLTGTALDLSALAQTSGKFQAFHRQLMSCILEGNEQQNACIDQIKLSTIPELMWDSTH